MCYFPIRELSKRNEMVTDIWRYYTINRGQRVLVIGKYVVYKRVISPLYSSSFSNELNKLTS